MKITSWDAPKVTSKLVALYAAYRIDALRQSGDARSGETAQQARSEGRARGAVRRRGRRPK